LERLVFASGGANEDDQPENDHARISVESGGVALLVLLAVPVSRGASGAVIGNGPTPTAAAQPGQRRRRPGSALERWLSGAALHRSRPQGHAPGAASFRDACAARNSACSTTPATARNTTTATT